MILNIGDTVIFNLNGNVYKGEVIVQSINKETVAVEYDNNCKAIIKLEDVVVSKYD